MSTPFRKPATTYGDQVALLRQRGMIIKDAASAEFYLQHINYYRLSAYWLPFEADHATHRFKVGTDFDQVLNHYIFDRELRLLVLDAIERIEVSVRSQWAYQLAHRHGPHAHLDRSLAFNQHHWQSNSEKLANEVNRSEEAFIRHMLSTYSEPLPPVWAACEVMSIGLLSQWYNSLKPMPTRRAIASVYGLDEKVLQSWLHHLSLVRNLSAHHSRLWNRDFSIIPQPPKGKPAKLGSEFVRGSRKIYNTFLIILHFMDVVAPHHHWRSRLKDLIAQHGVEARMMDFPVGWEKRFPWRGWA